MNRTTLGSVLLNLDELDWRQWVYIEMQAGLSASASCLVINPDEAELGPDDFTPLAAEEASMQEFLSVQDLRSVVRNMKTWREGASVDDLSLAAIYYFENDGFMPSEKLT
jgi:EAL domain-containing protein (putative c-di-GMP-specific phosphodiesterase class I)